MDKTMKNKKLVCSICKQEILKHPNSKGKRYAIRQSDPVICDRCVYDLVDIDEENQDYLNQKIYNNIEKVSSQSNKSYDKSFKEVNLKTIIKNVKKVIKGQDNQIETIATVMYKNYKINNEALKSNIIISGESGSGKTKTIKLLAKEFDVPYFIEDATRYTEAGYIGASIEEMFMNLYREAGDDISKAERGIIIIDEGDKKGELSSIDGFKSSHKGSVLDSLLTYLEGTKVPLTTQNNLTLGYLDTSKITFIFVGAFLQLSQIREKRINGKRAIGFDNGLAKSENIDSEYIIEDFIKGGFSKEFIGRFDTIIEFNTLTIENFKDIIENSEESTLKNYEYELKEKGINLVVEEDIVNEIALAAKKIDTGARAIKRVVQNLFKNILFNILINENKYKKCIINKNTVNNPKDFILL